MVLWLESLPYAFRERTMTSRVFIRLKVSPYDLIRDAVEAGVACGYRRAHKHVDKPEEDQIIESIQREIMNSLCEIIEFDSEGDEA